MDIDHRLRTASVNGEFFPPVHPTLTRLARPQEPRNNEENTQFFQRLLRLDSLSEWTRID